MSETPPTQAEIPSFTWESAASEYRIDPAPVEVILPDGSKPTFKALPNMRARSEMEKAVDEALSSIPGVEDKGHSKHWIRSVPNVPYSDQRILAEFSLRSIAPCLSLETAFRLFEAPTVVAQIADKLNRADKELSTLYFIKQAEIAAGKSKTSGQDESSSPANEDSPDETPQT